jgi:KUP system potassium uptake protein
MSTSHAADGESPQKSSLNWKLTLGCIGVVYGDIGTSPLYAFREAAKHVGEGKSIEPTEIYGLLSLIIWILVINVTLKYVLFLLRVDNKGEGGSLALMALARKAAGRFSGFVFFLGILGASLFYGEAAITPAISVLSAVEGMELVTPAFKPFVLPIVIVILISLFWVQRSGTEKVSNFFGPITAFWFLSIGALGISWIIEHPAIFHSFNPYYALSFLLTHGKLSMVVMGAAFLAVTGTEALYVDLGHFGRKPIQRAWIWLVFPCLVLNYLGQGALLLQNPEAIDNTFFLLAPEWLLVPLILLATVATIIASQAVITGAFSMAQQAIQFGLLPRMEIRHTSVNQEGQIYMPKINRTLLITVLLLTVIFGSSSSLASAYGFAVNGTMIVTTLLAFIVVWRVWKKGVLFAACVTLPFLCIELVFLWSNVLKLLDGGFVPLILASFIVLLMTIWVRGTRYLYRKAHIRTVALTDLLETLDREAPARVDGTAIFLTSDPQVAPVALIQNLRHNHVLHAHNVILTVVTTHTPKVSDEQRFIIEHLSSSVMRMILIFGFMETPNVPRALSIARRQYGLDINLQDATFFLGRRSIISSHTHQAHDDLIHAWHKEAPPPKRRNTSLWRVTPHHGLPEWQDHIYIALANSAVTATDFFHIPRNQVVEMGTQIAV